MGSLTGCIGSFDAAAPAWRVANDGDEGIVVRVEGEGRKTDILAVRVDAQDAVHSDIAAEKCIGVRMVVETSDGEEIGRVEEPACLGWNLTVLQDGTLDYQEM